MEKWLEIGLSGWIIFIITVFFGGGFVVRHIIRRRTCQTHIKAGGDVAGGDIIHEKHQAQKDSGSSIRISHSVQGNITAKGDVAGGDIIKNDK